MAARSSPARSLPIPCRARSLAEPLSDSTDSWWSWACRVTLGVVEVVVVVPEPAPWVCRWGPSTGAASPVRRSVSTTTWSSCPRRRRSARRSPGHRRRDRVATGSSPGRRQDRRRRLPSPRRRSLPRRRHPRCPVRDRSRRPACGSPITSSMGIVVPGAASTVRGPESDSLVTQPDTECPGTEADDGGEGGGAGCAGGRDRLGNERELGQPRQRPHRHPQPAQRHVQERPARWPRRTGSRRTAPTRRGL